MKKTTTILAAMLMVINIIQAQWTELGSDHPLAANNLIFSITTDQAGNVYAAGEFSDTFTRTYYVAKWQGDSAWVPLGTGANALKANGYIYSIATDAAGNVYAAGAFTDAQYQSSGNIYVAKWDGTSWTKLGASGVSHVPNSAGSAIYSIALDASGNIYAAGAFKNSGSYYYVCKWDGSAWAELGTGSNALKANHYIHNVVTDPSGNVYATGDFTDANGAQYVAEWNGTSWSEMGTGSQALDANSPITALTADVNGNVYVAYADSFANYHVAKWNGSNWNNVGALHVNNSINTLTTDNAGNLYAAGNFSDGNGGKYVAKYDTAWSELGTGTNALNANSYILTLATDVNRNVYAAGHFTDLYNTYYVAKYDPNNQGPNGMMDISSVSDLILSPNPANDHLNITISTTQTSSMTVVVYDMSGREIRTLYQGVMESGKKNIIFDTHTIVAGVYLIKISDGKSNTQKRFVKI
jgi:uncharacterized Rossmann fold enzyme